MNSLFNISEVVTFLWLPIGIVAIVALLFIPSLLVPEAKPHAIARAITCYLLKTLGLCMIGISLVVATINMMSFNLPEFSSISVLLLLFVVGLGLAVHQSQIESSLDNASVNVVSTIFYHSYEIIGAIVVLFSLLSLSIQFLLTQQIEGWQLPATFSLFGLLLMLAASIHIQREGMRFTKKSIRVAKRK